PTLPFSSRSNTTWLSKSTLAVTSRSVAVMVMDDLLRSPPPKPRRVPEKYTGMLRVAGRGASRGNSTKTSAKDELVPASPAASSAMALAPGKAMAFCPPELPEVPTHIHASGRRGKDSAKAPAGVASTSSASHGPTAGLALLDRTGDA